MEGRQKSQSLLERVELGIEYLALGTHIAKT
jgi:hypothetical protein